MIDSREFDYQTSSKKTKVFDCALYLTPPKFKVQDLFTPVKNCSPDKERKVITNGSETTLTPSEMSNQHLKQSDIKFCISNDLLKKLDESSPLKTLVFTESKQSNFTKNCAEELVFTPNGKAEAFNESDDVIELTYEEPRPRHIPAAVSFSSKNLSKPNFLQLLEESNFEENAQDNTFGRSEKRCLTELQSLNMNGCPDRKLDEDLKGGWMCPGCRNFNLEKKEKVREMSKDAE